MACGRVAASVVLQEASVSQPLGGTVWGADGAPELAN